MNDDLTQRQMVAMLAAELERQGMTQANFARLAGVTEKHVSQVLGTQTKTAAVATLDYWAFLLGKRFTVSLTASAASVERCGRGRVDVSDLEAENATLRARVEAAEAERGAAIDTLNSTELARERAVDRVEALTAALAAIRDLPTEHDLLWNAMAKAMFTYADRVLSDGETP